MLLHKQISTHGRLVPKPEAKKVTEEEILEEPSTIQDQIENLRTKISLKERHTKVLEEELEESSQGTSTVLIDLYYETRGLRVQLMEALGAEKKAVQNALRTYREFQLAMTNRSPTVAIPWLEDKLFDIIKCFNALLDKLHDKRRKLEDSERLVCMLEKWPLPGSLPWEIKALTKFHKIETQIENTRIKRETAQILYSKYKEIKFILREEKGKYLPSLQQHENQLCVQKKELQNLNKMLTDANLFRDDSYKNLIATEKEASENRKIRRQQMNKIKKAVDKALSENHAVPGQADKSQSRRHTGAFAEEDKIDYGEFHKALEQKNLELAEFEERAKRIVESMRVNDLTQIPRRYRTVRALSKHLSEEKASKSEIRDNLLSQRDQLILILSHFRYTGAKNQDDHAQQLKQFDHAIEVFDNGINKNSSHEQEHGTAIVDLRLTLLALLARFDEGAGPIANGAKKQRKVDINMQMKLINTKCKTAVKEVHDFEELFGDKEADRNYAAYAKPPQTPYRLVRVGGAKVDSESEEDEDLPDSHVPGRLDIKAKNQRFKQQAILKRGLK